MTIKKYFSLVLVALMMTTLGGCQFIEDVFKSGVWSGIIIVVVVLALMIWVLSRIFGGSGRN